jgi:DNA-binding LytR/AlgR family response regulator
MTLKKYHCLVVDDEPIARKIITNYIAQLPFLTLAAEQVNALDTIEYLRSSGTADIICMDINMPHLSGLQLLKIVQPKQPVIFTTAYAEYAVESYELNAVDYLLKPFSFERFTKAIYKAIDALKKKGETLNRVENDIRPSVFIKSDGKNYPILLDDILYCEARKNYTMVVLHNERKLMPLIPLSKLESLLLEAGGDFIQVHRSFLISKKHITSITPTTTMVQQYEIPLGLQFRDKFFKLIGMKDGFSNWE